MGRGCRRLKGAVSVAETVSKRAFRCRDVLGGVVLTGALSMRAVLADALPYDKPFLMKAFSAEGVSV